MAEMLSKSFALAEFERTSTGLPNKCPPNLIPNLKSLCEHVLEPLRAHYRRPVHINSGYRSPAVNAAVGSKPASQHATGCACDLEIPGVSNLDVARWIAANLDFDQLILENHKPGQPSSGWVHVSWVSGPRRKQVLTATMGSHGMVYKQGLPE